MSTKEIRQVKRLLHSLYSLLGDKFSYPVASVILEVMNEEDLSPETYCRRLSWLEPEEVVRIIKKLTGEPNNWRRSRQIIWWRRSKDGVDTIRLASRGRSFRGSFMGAIQDPY